LVALLLIPASLICTSAAAIDTGGVGILGGLRREATLEPGQQSQRGTILVTNAGAEPAEVKVYQTDYTPLIGGCKYGEPGRSPRSNAKWIALTPLQFVIPPGDSTQVYYTISVPADPELRGSYWSMIMVEPIRPISEQEPKRLENDQIGVGVRSVVRYAVLMVTHVGNTGTRGLRIVERTMDQAKDKRLLQLHVENTGERLLRCKVWADLYDQEGRYIGRYGREPEYGFYPGCVVQAQIDLTEVPPGAYKALVVLDAGGEDVFGAQYDLQLEGPTE